ncbi:hypothetical protein BDBG_09442, partial [Blastomyces gilchristii SLH14081]
VSGAANHMTSILSKSIHGLSWLFVMTYNCQELKQSQPAQLIGRVSMMKTFFNFSALEKGMGSPSIACIGIIGKLDNPLHISIFPPHEDSRLELSLLLNSCLDLVAIRWKHTSVDQYLGLLHSFDERFAAYGWLTNTGVKFLIIVDMDGNVTSSVDKKKMAPLVGLRDSDLKPAFRVLQTAYIKLLQNPFYQADDTNPVGRTTMFTESFKTASNQFIREIQMIGRSWSVEIAEI